MRVGILAFVLSGLLSGVAMAAPLTLTWQPVPDAAKYTLYDSVDNGVTWRKVADTTSPSLLVDAPDTGLVLYYVSATNAKGESANRSRGAWFNWQWQSLPNKLAIQ